MSSFSAVPSSYVVTSKSIFPSSFVGFVSLAEETLANIVWSSPVGAVQVYRIGLVGVAACRLSMLIVVRTFSAEEGDN